MNREGPQPGDLIHVVRSQWSALNDGEWLRVCEQPYWTEDGKELNVAPRQQVRVFCGPDHGSPDGITPEHVSTSGGPFLTVGIEELVGLKRRCTATDIFWCWRDRPSAGDEMDRPVNVTIWCCRRLANSDTDHRRPVPEVTWRIGSPTPLPNTEDTTARPDSLPVNQLAAFDGDDSPGRIRLGCTYCDRDDFDGVSELPKDWLDLKEWQGREESVRPANAAETQRQVQDWQTHLGICPECFAEMERLTDEVSADTGRASDEVGDREDTVFVPPFIQQDASNLQMSLELMAVVSRPSTQKSETPILPSLLTGSKLVDLMRDHNLTIAELAFRLGSTQKRVRQIRETGLHDPNVIRDWIEAVKGQDPGRLPERYHINGIADETECGFCGCPLVYGDDAWDYVGEIFCSVSCCQKSCSW